MLVPFKQRKLLQWGNTCWFNEGASCHKPAGAVHSGSRWEFLPKNARGWLAPNVERWVPVLQARMACLCSSWPWHVRNPFNTHGFMFPVLWFLCYTLTTSTQRWATRPVQLDKGNDGGRSPLALIKVIWLTFWPEWLSISQLVVPRSPPSCYNTL